jgi:hypothetical protein
VDVFFVISGYLITQILYREAREQRFSIARFYARRIRRIFPALFFVLAGTLVAGVWILLPDELSALARSAIAGRSFAQTSYSGTRRAISPRRRFTSRFCTLGRSRSKNSSISSSHSVCGLCIDCATGPSCRP